MEQLQTLPVTELPEPTTNGHHLVPDVVDPTEEDIASQFPALVQQTNSQIPL